MPAPGVSPAPAATDAAPAIRGEIVDATRIIAQVGDQPILAGDLLPIISSQLKQYEGKLKPEEFSQLQERGLQQLLPQAIEQKLLYLDFLRVVPAERLPEIFKSVGEKFEDSRLGPLMKSLQVTSLTELEEKLRDFGSSIEKQRRRFVEQALAQEMLRRNVKINAEVTLDEMLAYYQANQAEFQYPEQVRWEGLSISFDKIPDKREAYRAMAGLGNQVLGGAPFADVAKRGSHGPDAVDGGQHDWTARGVLANRTIEEAIFSLPEGRLSAILEDANGFYIVRVKERKPAGAESFESAQIGIKEKIKKERIKVQSATYLARLRERTRVWTIYDGAAIATGPQPQLK